MRRRAVRVFTGIVIAALPALSAAAALADTLASGETKLDTVSFNGSRSYDFSGTAGDRIVVTASEHSGAIQPDVYLYFNDETQGQVLEDSQAGPFAEKRLERNLASTGTYTIVVRENGSDQAGAYSIALAQVPGSATSASDADGGAAESGGTYGGLLQYQADTEVLTIDCTKDDRIIVTVSDLSNSCQPELYLYPPSGAAAEATRTGAALQKKLETRVLETGTYRILICDSGLNQEGYWSASVVRIPGGATAASDTDGGALPPTATRTGTLTPRADMDVFTFDGAAGDRVIVTSADFGQSTQSELYLYPPGGGDLEASSVGLVLNHRIERTLAATGTYTVVVHDSGLNGEGSYAVSMVRLPGAATAADEEDEGGVIPPGASKLGRLRDRADMDVWQFWGAAGARVLVTTANLAGGVQPEIYLYPADGGDAVATETGGLTIHKLDAQLPASGLYNVVVTDYLNRHDDGYYLITLATLPGPATSPDDDDGGPVDFDRDASGGFQGAGDFDLWQFYGNAGDQMTINASRSANAGGGIEPEIVLYPPDSGAAETSATGGGSTRRLVWQLKKTGLYTIALNDASGGATGLYTLNVSKSPPTRATGVYNQFPPLGARISDLAAPLRWSPVAGATSYDVRIGTDLLAELPLLHAGIPANSGALPEGMGPDETWYWQVVAHTPGGDVPGPVLWFTTGSAPVVAADDFTDGDATGDKNWFVVSGIWKVDGPKRYVTTGLSNQTIQDCRAIFTATGDFVAGEFSSRVQVTNVAIPGYTKSNAELCFAFQDPFHYRYVRLTQGRLELGQTGAFGGDDDRSKVAKKAKIALNGTVDVKVVVGPDGQVDVFLKTAKAKKFPAKPALTHRFQGAMPGFLGYRAMGCRSRFDNFAATSRAFVP